jgi:hypothetical protein
VAPNVVGSNPISHPNFQSLTSIGSGGRGQLGKTWVKVQTQVETEILPKLLAHSALFFTYRIRI